MTYELSYSAREGCIVIRVDEPFSWQLAMRMAREALAMARRHGVLRILYDVRRAPNKESLVDDFRIAHGHLLSLGMPRGIMAAIVAAPEDHSYDRVVTLCLNAGVNVMLFREEEPALTWLREAPDGEERGRALTVGASAGPD